MSTGLAAFAFVVVFLLTLLAVVRAERPYVKVETRMHRLIRRTRAGDTVDDILAEVEHSDEPQSPGDLKRLARQRDRLMKMVSERMAGEGIGNAIAQKLRRADLKLQVAEFLLIVLGMAIGGVVLGWLIDRALFGILMGIIGAAAPFVLLNRRVNKRKRLLEDQLAEALSLIGNSLRSGYSFLQAMDVVAKESPPPISKEFEMVLRETRVNIPIEEALQNLVARANSEDLDLTVTAMLIQRQVGGNMAEVMDNIATTIRDRAKLAGEVQTLTATGRMSGWVVASVPAALVVVVSLINPDFMKPLWTHPIGWAALGIAAFMQLTGVFLISRIIKVKY